VSTISAARPFAGAVHGFEIVADVGRAGAGASVVDTGATLDVLAGTGAVRAGDAEQPASVADIATIAKAYQTSQR
jgi:hypothetical protein